MPFREELDALGVPYECGGHSADALKEAALVIPSPGVPLTCFPVQEALRCGIEVLGEMEFASRFCTSRIVAVTGTNGKTTTTELLYRLIAACGPAVALAGNNDRPFSGVVLEDTQPDYVVLEVSSYQLETATTFHPWAGIVLNVTPDHLARHGTIENYAAVKAKLFANQQSGDVAILNQDNPWTRAMAVPDDVDLVWFSLKERSERGLWLDGDAIRAGDECVAMTSDTPLPGHHNLENVLASLCVMRAGGFDWDKTLACLRTFRGVEHRIEFVLSANGVAFYNDSKSTNIDSLKVALDSFEQPVVLIAGGEGKGADYGVLRDQIRERVKALVTIGQDAPLLEQAFGDVVATSRAETMEQAVELAASAAGANGTVLLSPACASFDMYDNFEHRGRVFKACVREWALEHGDSLEKGATP